MSTEYTLLTDAPSQEIREALADYLIKLSLDPSQAEAFRENPISAMEAENLSESDQAIVLSGKPGDIYDALGEGQYVKGAVVVVAIVVANASNCGK